ncbi:cytosolic sulfotransferase 15 [Cannabis sativa]|uniref:cytosolic sulfotransferase 15 n=1 Tax=Cannabis sativa TaxID=3483 RepID=UPI0029C9D9E8|nr:cytosolic sulfotransferase 15 [Cannabis sativa]
MERDDEKIDEILTKLEKIKDPVGDIYRYNYQGFWIEAFTLKGLIPFQTQFEARDDDIILASCPKSGTTWLKSLIFSIGNRNNNSNINPFTTSNVTFTSTVRYCAGKSNFYQHISQTALAKRSKFCLFTANPHDLIPMLELSLPMENMIKPRLLNTHIPYPSLPPSIKDSHCKIVYICRNPLDVFVSHWHFAHRFSGEDDIEPCHLEECFDMFCKGIHAFGPFWDHILGFWKASLEMPRKILFLKYEELMKNDIFFIKKIAHFLGFHFSKEEEHCGVPQQIEQLCSFENLKNINVNKTGKHSLEMSNSSFFRKGEIGDWVNYLTPQMAEHGKKLIQEKIGESGLMFDFLD